MARNFEFLYFIPLFLLGISSISGYMIAILKTVWTVFGSASVAAIRICQQKAAVPCKFKCSACPYRHAYL